MLQIYKLSDFGCYMQMYSEREKERENIEIEHSNSRDMVFCFKRCFFWCFCLSSFYDSILLSCMHEILNQRASLVSIYALIKFECARDAHTNFFVLVTYIYFGTFQTVRDQNSQSCYVLSNRFGFVLLSCAKQVLLHVLVPH